jgi:hypothetical protein
MEEKSLFDPRQRQNTFYFLRNVQTDYMGLPILLQNEYLGSFRRGKAAGRVLLWRLEQLLRNDRATHGYSRAVSRQRFGRHVPAETNTHATLEVLLETGCFYGGQYREDRGATRFRA